jgi:hypothetical protein
VEHLFDISKRRRRLLKAVKEGLKSIIVRGLLAALDEADTSSWQGCCKEARATRLSRLARTLDTLSVALLAMHIECLHNPEEETIVEP